VSGKTDREFKTSSISNPQSTILNLKFSPCSMLSLIPNINSHNEMEEKNGQLEPEITRFLTTKIKIDWHGKDVEIYDER
jgi:hypothetical protein